jgi:hypothetical protein
MVPLVNGAVSVSRKFIVKQENFPDRQVWRVVEPHQWCADLSAQKLLFF